MKIKIDPSGSVHAVYSDRLNGLKLGPMEVSRASNVEFDHARQQWVAHTPAGELLASGTSRDAVIRSEVEIIESRL